MSSSRLLDFFILEASDYVERLDALLSESGDRKPDAEALTAQARLLRGSATMARQSPIADLASAVERIGRALRDDIVEWTPQLLAALVAAVDDLKILIRAVRTWGSGDDRRTESRLSELVSLYPQATKSHPTPPTNSIRNSSFIASEAAQLATALDTLVSHPSSSESLAAAVQRLSTLRGVAAVNDTPPLGQVLTALDDVLRPIDARGGVPEMPAIAVMTAAVQLLRRLSQEIAIGGRPDPSSAAVQAFNATLAGLKTAEGDDAGDEEIVPISQLNFEDGDPQLVSSPAPPPRTAEQRFRIEIVGPSEHLRHQAAQVRSATDEFSRRHAAHGLRRSFRMLRTAVAGFEGFNVVEYMDTLESALDAPDERTLSLVDELSRALLDQSLPAERLATRLKDLLEARHVAEEITRGFGDQVEVEQTLRRTPPAETQPAFVPSAAAAAEPVRSATPAEQQLPPAVAVQPRSPTPAQPRMPTPAQPRQATPAHSQPAPAASNSDFVILHGIDANAQDFDWTPAEMDTSAPAAGDEPLRGAELTQALQDGIRSFGDLAEHPLSEPAALEEEVLVPIEDLLYRGRHAISRAIEIRDQIRADNRSPKTNELDELFELLELALTE